MSSSDDVLHPSITNKHGEFPFDSAGRDIYILYEFPPKMFPGVKLIKSRVRRHWCFNLQLVVGKLRCPADEHQINMREATMSMCLP